MANYATTLVDEAEDSGEVTEIQPTPKRWRWLALAAMTVAGVLAVASIGWPRKKLTTRQRLKKATRSLISAYKRKLEDDPEYPLHEQMTAVVKPVGADDPATTKIEIQLKTHDEELEKDVIRFHFTAKEGQQDALEQTWQDLAAAFDNEEYAGAGAQMGSLFDISKNDPNEVVIKMEIPPQDGDDAGDDASMEQEVEHDLSKLSELDPFPLLKLELSTARDLDEMLNNLGEPSMLVPGGFSVSGSFGMAKELIESIAEMEREQNHEDVAGKLQLGSEIETMVSTSHSTIEYDEEKVRKAEEANAKGPIPSGEEALNMMKQGAQQSFPDENVQDLIKQLGENSDGLKTIRLQATNKYEVVITFTNFKVSAALAKLMEPVEGGETEGGESE